MTSFGWKRKAGQSVSKAKSQAFEENSKEVDADLESRGIDWLTLMPNKKLFSLEDATAKSNRLQREGSILAEAERFWEAIQKWDLALQFIPNSASLYEMKAQAYIHLNEVLPAVAAARKAVEEQPTWWVAHQTLGRAQLGLGEVRMAQKSFSRAVHINPCDEELWKEDLEWSAQLLERQRNTKDTKEEEEKEGQKKAQIIELDQETVEEGTNKDLIPVKRAKIDANFLLPVDDMGFESNAPKTLKRLPQNMVHMRN